MITTIRDAIAVILGGGRGTRLYPLTRYRAKPAVPIAGKFRLVDIPISNCLHSGLDRIFVLTQFNSASLNRHIVQTYRFDSFSKGYIQILAAQQTLRNADWYQGTADAVRQNLRRLMDTPCKYVLILAGDHLYKMDYQKIVQEHEQNNADITVTVLPVEREEVSELGILKTSIDGRITDFVEKPQGDDEIKRLEIEEAAFQKRGIESHGRSHVASMGIYLFNKDVLFECLENEEIIDFGKDVIPDSIGEKRVYGSFFDGYWRDVGTIKSFYQANLELTHIVPEFDFYDEDMQVYTHPRFLPGTKVNGCLVQSSILCEGSVLTDCEIRNSIVGVRSIIHSGAEMHNSVMMGADYYDSAIANQCSVDSEGPLLGVGRESVIKNAIIDKNARIGCNVRILNEKGIVEADGDGYCIREGIVVVHKDAVIKDYTII